MIPSEETILNRWSPVQMAREIVRLQKLLALPSDKIHDIKKHVLTRLLLAEGGSRKKAAAAAMGVGLRTVYRLVKQYNLKGFCVRDHKGKPE